MAAGYDGTIRIDSKVDTKGFNQGVKQMSGGMGSLIGIISKIGIAIGAAFAISKIVTFGKAALMAAANLERLQQAAVQVGATFGVTAEEVSRIVKEVIALGIQDDVAYEAFINLARNGLDTGLLPALARGAQDLNAFSDTGVSSSEVLDRLMTGIITLQTETLRTAGVIVDITQASKTWALANDTVIESMTAQEKQAAVMIAVIEKLKGVEGLYELSQRTAAGQMSSRTRIMNNFMMALGGPFMNALYIAIRTFNQFVTVLTSAIKPGGQLYSLMVSLGAVATWVANAFRTAMIFIAGLFGIVLPDLQAVATTADPLAGSLDDAAAGAGDLADATASAGKAAKGALAPFDELNVLAQDAGGGGGTPPGGGGGLPTPVPFVPIDSGLLDAINAKLAEWKANLAGLGVLFQPIIDALGRLWTASEPLRETLWTGLKWLWDNILVPFSTWVATALVPAFLDLLGAALVILNQVLIAFQPLAKMLWETFLKPLAEWTGGIIIKILEGLTGWLTKIGDWMKQNPEAVRAFATILGLLVVGFVAVNIAIAIFNILLAANPIGLVIMGILLLIGVILWLKAHWEELPEIAAKAWEGIKKAFGAAWDWFKKTVVDPIAHLFKGSGLFDDIILWAQEAWDGIVAVFVNAWTWFDTTVIQPLKTGWETFWNGLSATVKKVVNIIIGFINGMISAIVIGINAVIEAINSIKVTIPKWVPIIGGSSIGFNLGKITAPQIPLLAGGAIIPPNAAFAAILGDQRVGKNLEAPETLIRQIVREESGGGMNGQVVVRFEGSLAALVRELKPVIDKENTRIGKSLVRVEA